VDDDEQHCRTGGVRVACIMIMLLEPEESVSPASCSCCYCLRHLLGGNPNPYSHGMLPDHTLAIVLVLAIIPVQFRVIQPGIEWTQSTLSAQPWQTTGQR
jgi:hypothetical protein